MALLELVRALDTLYVRTLYHGREAIPDDARVLVDFGANAALDLFLDESCDAQGVPLFPSTPELHTWAIATLQHAGRIGIVRECLEYVRQGLCQVTETSTGHYEFFFDRDPRSAETHEELSITWLAEQTAKSLEADAGELEKQRKSVHKLMRARVSVWRDHYIQYTTHPRIDQYYDRRAANFCSLHFGTDALPVTSRLGGIEYSTYVQALRTLTGWAQKHVGFSTELLLKHSRLNPTNLLTIFQPVDSLADNLSHALDIPRSSAEQVLMAFTLQRTAKSDQLNMFGGAAPLFVEVGTRQLVRTVYGALSRPHRFMVRTLRSRYRSDWDAAVEDREVKFRADVFALFRGERYAFVDRRVNVPGLERKVATDLDATVFDKATNTLALFQLKWQDPYDNLRERRSRRSNLLKEGNSWVGRVAAWLDSASLEDLVTKFPEIRGSGSRPSVALFVVGRHAAHFAPQDAEERDPRATWTFFPHLARAVLEQEGAHNVICAVVDTLNHENPSRLPPRHIGDQRIQLGETTVVVRVRPHGD